MNLTLLAGFLAAVLVICILPGPDMLFVLASGLARGARAGVAAAFGMAAGMVVHTSAAALGLAALFRSAPAAFTVVRFAGAAYLAWLAVQMFRRPVSRDARQPARPPAGRRGNRGVFLQAALTNVANPKVILFYLAFLPQFVDYSRGHVAIQFLVLGALFLLVGLVVDCLVGLTAGRIGRLLHAHADSERWANRVAATVFGGLAVRLILAR